MHPLFSSVVEMLPSSLEKLLAVEPVKIKSLPSKPQIRGIYLFSENGQHLYIGRSNDIRRRYSRHCDPGASHTTASFAFLLAREATGKTKASYKSGEESRQGLMQNTKFKAAFIEAKTRIRNMDFRYVEETNPIQQALLEIYCSIALSTPHNDFDNH